MTLLKRLKYWTERRQRAQRFGIRFYRSRTLRTETSLIKLGFRIERHVPVNWYGDILAVRSP